MILPIIPIFILEDDKDDVQFIDQAFKMSDIKNYEFFYNPKEFFALFNDNVPIAIIDGRLPGMNGEEALERVLNVNKKCRVIMMSGVVTAEAALNFWNMGAKNFVEKKPGWETRLAKYTKFHVQEVESEIAEEQYRKRQEEILRKEIRNLWKKNV
jgi:DNA-binding NtrC family response regulator